MIRREDVRQTEKDRVELSKCFRPSDIVLATIISLGDQSNYLLSTAGDSLGFFVLIALFLNYNSNRSDTGNEQVWLSARASQLE